MKTPSVQAALVTLAAALVLALAGPAHSQSFPVFATTPNPVGSGARALGMGGAFIAVADDATAASWNPAGLIQLEEPEVSVVNAFFTRDEDNTISNIPEGSGTETLPIYGDLNFLSLTYPFVLFDRNMVFSMTYQNLYDFTRNWNFPWFLNEQVFSVDIDVDHMQAGELNAIGFSLAALVSPDLSLGATLNLWHDNDFSRNSWGMRTRYFGEGQTFSGIPLTIDYTQRDEYTFKGLNANFNAGFMWFIDSNWTLGGVFKYPLTAELDHTTTITDRSTGTLNTDPVTTQFDEKLHMPLSYGLGVGYRFSDAFSMTLDVYRTEWSQFGIENEDGDVINPFSGEEVDHAYVGASTQVRLGAEYLIIGENYLVPLRAGVFYDPAPTRGGVDDFYGFTLGTGFAYDRFVWDIAYMYRFGHDVNSHILANQGFSQDFSEHAIYTSLIIHF